MAKIAVATSDGNTIDEHFGQARVFRIYEVNDDGSYAELELRTIGHSAQDPARAHTADTTIAQLGDVDVVLASQIGPSAAATLTGRGIKSFAVRGGVDRALASYGKRHKLLDQEIPGITGCRPSASCGCSRHGGK
jgi:nitrogen fixation protein NifX